MPQFKKCDICKGLTENWIIYGRKVHHIDPRECITNNKVRDMIERIEGQEVK